MGIVGFEEFQAILAYLDINSYRGLSSSLNFINKSDIISHKNFKFISYFSSNLNKTIEII